MTQNVHIVPREIGWGVKVEKSSRDVGTCKTQAEAIELGKRVAQALKSDNIVHGRDGKIRARNSYGNDPYPPKDTRP